MKQTIIQKNNLFINQEVENSNLKLKILYLELKYYNEELMYIEKHKPFKFQKNKLWNFENKKSEIKKHIENCNKNIQNEYEWVSKIIDK